MKDDFVSDEAKQVTDLGWDKFMDDIIKREVDIHTSREEHAKRFEDHPTRKLDRRIRETPHNRTKYIRK
jgi:hypothetical protein